MASEYAELRKRIKDAGLLEKRPGYYGYKILFNFSLLALGIWILLTWDAAWILILNAVLFGFVFGQAGYVGHDAGHNQIMRSNFGNGVIRVFSSFFIAISRSWWITEHNEHHNNPNNLARDPHTKIPLMAFSGEQAGRREGLKRFFIRLQPYYFPFLMAVEGISMRNASIQFIFRRGQGSFKKFEELAIIALHFALYFGVLFSVMDVGEALLFIAVHQLFFGLYMASAFAPNHKGMLIVNDEEAKKLGSLRLQVFTTRNVMPGILNDFWYGGLNYQIEHHLFPSMPRCNLGKARVIVKEFCDERKISYRETSPIESWRQIFASLNDVATSAVGPSKV